jgi:hypothetical protein
MTGNGSIDGISHKDDRVIVGEGNAAAVQLYCHAGNRFRAGRVRNCVDFAGFADVPVLAELAGQVAARCAERQYRGAGMEMVKRFFLNGINAKAAGTSLGREHETAILVGAHETQSRLACMQLAGARADVTHDPPVIESMPVAGVRDACLQVRAGVCSSHLLSSSPAVKEITLKMAAKKSCAQ